MMYDVRVELIHSMYNMSNIYKLGKFVVYLKRLRMKRWINYKMMAKKREIERTKDFGSLRGYPSNEIVHHPALSIIRCMWDLL